MKTTAAQREMAAHYLLRMHGGMAQGELDIRATVTSVRRELACRIVTDTLERNPGKAVQQRIKAAAELIRS